MRAPGGRALQGERRQGRVHAVAARRCAPLRLPAGRASPDSSLRLPPSAPDDYTGYYYGPDHPMKPQRMAMTHQLVLGYGLHQHLSVYVRAGCCLLD